MMRTMKVFDFRKIDYLLKHKQVRRGASYKIKEPDVVFKATNEFWDVFRMF